MRKHTLICLGQLPLSLSNASLGGAPLSHKFIQSLQGRQFADIISMGIPLTHFISLIYDLPKEIIFQDKIIMKSILQQHGILTNVKFIAGVFEVEEKISGASRHS